jgi:aminoglycoside phosphotransferase (APT) family kinase protein
MSAFDHFVGTRPVTGSHAFDISALEAWLSAKLPGFAGPLSVEMFKGGQSNPTYKLITPSRQYPWPSCCRRPTPSSVNLP